MNDTKRNPNVNHGSGVIVMFQFINYNTCSTLVLDVDSGEVGFVGMRGYVCVGTMYLLFSFSVNLKLL
jgi:hypothetical protein